MTALMSEPTVDVLPSLSEPNELAWGRHYVMVRPDHFRVEYAINPFMDVAVQPDAELALQQWQALVATIERLGGTVEVIDQREDAPDMVYAMNLGLVVERPCGKRSKLMSHMRFAERRMETESAHAWFAARDYDTHYIGRDGQGAHFEAGDAFAWGDALICGYGPRTEEAGLAEIARELEVLVRGVRITHPGMYHLDLAFCPLDATKAIVCPDAFDEASAQALLSLIPEPLIITEAEALETFAANSIVIGRTIIMPAVPDRVRAQLEAWGFEIVLLDLSEFHKGGGSIRCLTNPLDITVGRDLPHLASGAVVLP